MNKVNANDIIKFSDIVKFKNNIKKMLLPQNNPHIKDATFTVCSQDLINCSKSIFKDNRGNISFDKFKKMCAVFHPNKSNLFDIHMTKNKSYYDITIHYHNNMLVNTTTWLIDWLAEFENSSDVKWEGRAQDISNDIKALSNIKKPSSNVNLKPFVIGSVVRKISNIFPKFGLRVNEKSHDGDRAIIFEKNNNK